MHHRRWAFAAVFAALVASRAGAQPMSDVQAFAVAKSYPGNSGLNASDPVMLLVIGKGCVHPLGAGIARNGNAFEVTLATDPPPPILPIPCGSFAVDFFVDRLPAATYQVRVTGDGQLVHQSSFIVHPPEQALLFDGTSIAFELEYKVPGMPATKAFAVPLANTAGYFWFFAPESPEVQLRLIDGRPLNGHRWLFVATSTSLELDLIAKACPPVDPLLCFELKRYHQPAGRFRPIFDFAFD